MVELPASVAANHPHAYFLEVMGDCMDKVYPDGCLILVDPDQMPADGSIAAVSIDGTDYVMRRLHKGASSMMLSPESTNPEHKDIVITSGDGHTVSLVGTVVWYQPAKELEKPLAEELFERQRVPRGNVRPDSDCSRDIRDSFRGLRRGWCRTVVPNPLHMASFFRREPLFSRR